MYCIDNPNSFFCNNKSNTILDTKNSDYLLNNSTILEAKPFSSFKKIPNDKTTLKVKKQSSELLHSLHTDFKNIPHKTLNNYLGKNTLDFDNPMQKKYALAANSAYAFSYKDKVKLNKIMKELPNFKIDEKLSGKNSVTLVNNLNKEVIISYRGSDAEFFKLNTISMDPKRIKNIEDWYVNLLTSIGQQRTTQRYNEASQRYENVFNKYGNNYKISVTGHSNGGGQSNFISEKYNVEGHHFNPAINPLQKPVNTPTKKQYVYSTEGDLVSFPARLKPHANSNYKIIHINPKPGTENDLVKLHDIEQMYTENYPKTERVSTARSRFGFANAIGGSVIGGYFGYYQPTSSTDEHYFRTTQGVLEAVFLNEAQPINFTDFMDTMGVKENLEEKNYLRKYLGLHPIKENNIEKVPSFDPITEKIRKITGRKNQDKQLFLPTTGVTYDDRKINSGNFKKGIKYVEYDGNSSTSKNVGVINP